MYQFIYLYTKIYKLCKISFAKVPHVMRNQMSIRLTIYKV